MSPAILQEVQEVLSRKRFHFIGEDKIKEFIMLISQLAEVVHPGVTIDICRDKDDNKFIEVALAGKADYIISGDDDMLAVHTYDGIIITSPESFLQKKSI